MPYVEVTLPLLTIKFVTYIARMITSVITATYTVDTMENIIDDDFCPVPQLLLSNETDICKKLPSSVAILDNPYFLWVYYVILLTIFLDIWQYYYPISVPVILSEVLRNNWIRYRGAGINRAFGRRVVLEIFKAFTSLLKKSITKDTKNDALVNFIHSTIRLNENLAGTQSRPDDHTGDDLEEGAIYGEAKNQSPGQLGDAAHDASNKKHVQLQVLKDQSTIDFDITDILEAAGESVKEEYTAKRQTNDDKYTKHGVVMTKSGKLSHYKKIFHITVFQDSPAKFRNAASHGSWLS